ncbi:unnamed protein product [Brassica rapa subsp. trilocularis]
MMSMIGMSTGLSMSKWVCPVGQSYLLNMNCRSPNKHRPNKTNLK